MNAKIDVMAVIRFEREIAIECGTLRAGSRRYMAVKAAESAVGDVIEALNGCVEHMEHSTPQGRDAYVAALEALDRIGSSA